MEEGVGFEPTEHSSRSSVFKTDALNRPLPTFHIDVVWQGLKDLNLQLLIWSQAVCQLSLSPFIFSYVCVFKNGADRGSRTPDLSLEGCDFTVKLHLHKYPVIQKSRVKLMFCFWILSLVFYNDSCLFCRLKMEHQERIELPTCWLQISCSANWAIGAYKGSNLRHSDYYFV